MTGLQAFTIDQVSRLTGLSERTLRYWADTNLFRPSYANVHGRPFGRVYSFRDVVALRTLARIRRDYGFPLQTIRRIDDWLSQHYDTPWSELRFYVRGQELFFEDKELGIRRAGSNPEQAAIPIEMKEIVLSTEADAATLRARSQDEIGQITQNRYVSHNAPVIAGTRIRTEAIWNFYEAGYSISDILRQYPRLTETDVRVAIQFEQRRHDQKTA